jgi:hypothetical protein
VSDDTRQRIAEELLEAVRPQHRSGQHLRERGAQVTLCGRPAVVVFRVHPTDRLCKACFERAFALVHCHNRTRERFVGPPVVIDESSALTDVSSVHPIRLRPLPSQTTNAPQPADQHVCPLAAGVVAAHPHPIPPAPPGAARGGCPTPRCQGGGRAKKDVTGRNGCVTVGRGPGRRCFFSSIYFPLRGGRCRGEAFGFSPSEALGTARCCGFSEPWALHLRGGRVVVGFALRRFRHLRPLDCCSSTTPVSRMA